MNTIVKTILLGTAVFLASCSTTTSEKKSSTADMAPAMEMTTEMPSGILTPNYIDSRIGELVSVDGVPTKETLVKIYDNLDYHHALQAFLSGIQIASIEAMRTGIESFGPPNTTVLLFEDLMDSKAL